jgi:membrane-associated phospholipid phosphatase
LTVLFVALCAGLLLVHRSPLDIAVLFLIQLISQSAIRRIKLVFRRTRPENWLMRKEQDASFPSGHASTGAVIFGGLAFLLWETTLPYDVRLAAAAGLVAIALGIGWSRIALGAHFLSDVLAGYVFGLLWFFAGMFLWMRWGH